MLQLIYSSMATCPFSEELLNDLLVMARARNSSAGVSGMLLYDSGAFLQVLEGPATAVEAVFASILKDKRHGQVRVLSRQTIDYREFEAWSMGFAETSAAFHPPGFVHYKNIEPQAETAETRARHYLRFFQDRSYRQNLLACEGLVKRPTLLL